MTAHRNAGGGARPGRGVGRRVMTLALGLAALLGPAALAAAATAGAADSSAAGKAIPTAEAVIERAVEAEGGRAPLGKLHNRRLIGVMEIPGMGVNAALTVYMERPNREYTEVTSSEIGELVSGTDGETCWENSAIQGPRIKRGGERALALSEADFDGLAGWKRWYAKAECAGADTAAGKAAWKVLMTPKEGDVETWYFDQETGLPLEQSLTITNQMGSIPVQNYPSDFRDVDGVLIPFRSRQVVMGGLQTMIMSIQSVVHDVEIPPGRFDLPPEVKALRDKAAAGSAAGSDSTGAAQDTLRAPSAGEK